MSVFVSGTMSVFVFFCRYHFSYILPAALQPLPHNMASPPWQSVHRQVRIPAAACTPHQSLKATLIGEQLPYTALQANDVYSIHARLSLRLLTALTYNYSSDPILPPNSFLNVNYPAVTDPCLHPAAFTFVLTRAFSIPFTDSPHTCGRESLPLEGDVLDNIGSCEVSISVLDAGTKLDKGREAQEAVMKRLQGFLGCSTV